MILKNFLKKLYFATFLFSSLLYSDGPFTAAVDDHDVQDGEYIDGITYVTSGATDVVNFNNGSIELRNDIIFQATVASGDDLTVNIGDGTPSSQVVLKPKVGTDVAPEYAHMIFEPELGRSVFVNVNSDLFLTGSNIDTSMISATDTNNYENSSLTLTFRGHGQTVFSFNDGKSMVFSSLIEDSVGDLIDATAAGSEGVSINVCMDQSKSEVVGTGTAIGLGKDKILVKRQNFPTGGDNDCELEIGLNSYLHFLSINYTGLDSSTDPAHSNIALNVSGTGTNLESYAAIAFDVSNYDKGRMVLRLTGAASDNTYTDGSFMLTGHMLDDGNFVGDPAADYSGNDDIRLNADFSQAAGCQAYLRVVDNTAAQDTTYADALDPGQTGEVGVITYLTDTAFSTRRGLKVVNSCRSIPAWASNLYGDAGWYNQEIFVGGLGNQSVRPGFVLGVNGNLEVFHNTFFEYEASSANINFEPANIGLTTLDGLLTGATPSITDPGTLFKQHNPSAFVVDGLGSVLVDENVVPTPGDPSDDTEKILFVAHTDPLIVRRAEINLIGNASITLRAPLLGTPNNYSGLRLPADGETFGDGKHVLDVEGLFTIRGIDDDFTPFGGLDDDQGRKTGSGYNSKDNSVRIGSLWRDFADREILNTSGLEESFVKRPLAITASTDPAQDQVLYTRYDRGSIIANASIEFENINFRNEDVSRDIKPDPAVSPPVIMGGERATFLKDVSGFSKPDILFLRLYNSTIHCHESMCVSGVRIVMKEQPTYLYTSPGYLAPPGTTSVSNLQNLSSIIMYNHGEAHDTLLKGHGRVFMLGSSLNEVANGGTSDQMKNAFFNIFRHTGGVDGLNPVNLPVTLSLKTLPEVPENVNPAQKAIQMFFLGNDSNVEVGWTTVKGISRDDNNIVVYPWDHLPLESVSTTSNFFDIDTTFELPATLSFEGDFIYLGGTGPNGEAPPVSVTGFDLGRVIYMGHGGKMQILADTTVTPEQPYVAFSDATIAIRLWKPSEPGLNTQLSLPHDQFILDNPIRPYDIDLNILTSGTVETDAHLRLSALTGSKLGTEVSIAWDQIIRVPEPPVSSFLSRDFVPPKSTPETLLPLYRNLANRAIARTTAPVAMPAQGLLMLTTDDYLDQIGVSGATLADPFQLYVTGSIDGIGQVRELVSEDSSGFVPGEGSFAKIFIDQGGRVGLGSRALNEKSVKAWNLIGKSHVTLNPNGDSQIDVNSDLLAADAQPIIPTVNFGSDFTLNGETVSPNHRITFFSHDTREVRIPSGFELDLGAFGQATTTESFTQQIAFGGRIRLIFEPGSALRFPELTGAAQDLMPILYMNEDSELIFEAINDMEHKYVGLPSDNLRWEAVTDQARAKIRMLGVGRIWINKRSKMIINDNALVAVEADDTTPTTNIEISLQREGQILLGTKNILGGSLQVGNPKFVYNPTTAVDDPYTVTGADISFKIRLNGENTKVNMGRNSFMGFGAGVIDRFENRINRWKIQTLNDVSNIGIRVIEGKFDHNQIFDGDSRESSLMAIGPISGGTYRFEFGPSNSILRGGGNIIYAGDVTVASSTDVLSVNVLNTATPLVFNATTDNGKYSIISSAPTLAQVQSLTSTDAGTTLGSGITFAPDSSFDASLLAGGFGFNGSQRDAYQYLAFKNVKEQTPIIFAALGKTNFQNRLGLVNDTLISRSEAVDLVQGLSDGDIDQVEVGAMRAATVDGLGNPITFALP